MKKFSRLTTQAMIISTLITMNATPVVANSQQTILANLPKTCLSVMGRMLPIAGAVTDSDHSKCHCPPLAMCTQTISYNGVTYPKLPKSVSDICCTKPAPPPPPLCVTINQACQTILRCSGSADVITPKVCTTPPTIVAPKECEVHYYKSTQSSCPDKTFIGTRIGGYCSQYTAPTGSPLTARVTSLNTCLRNRCKPIKTQISNINRTTVDFTKTNTIDREKAEMQAQIWLKDYVTCRRTCFNTSNFNNGINTKTDTLMQQSEIDLNKWIMLELSDNVTDSEVLGGTNETEALNTQFGEPTIYYTAMKVKFIPYPNPPLKYFTAKIYGPLFHTTINQHDQNTPQNNFFDWFFNNTYHPVKSGITPPLGFSYNKDMGILDTQLESATFKQINLASSGFIYFNNILAGLSSKFKNLNTITNDHGDDYIPPSWNGITCSETTFFGMCITTFSGDGSCESCLSPETNITMADGTLKAIKDLKMGDTVKAPYGNTGVIDEVVNIKWPKLELYNINDGQLRLTADHPIMTTGGWRAINYDARKDDSGYKRYGIATVAQLKIGDVIVTENGDVPVTRIMPDPVITDGETFNLKLKDNIKGFYANGILVKSNE